MPVPPYIAFAVDDLDEALKGREILIAPTEPSVGVRVAFILDDGAPVELLQFDTARRVPRSGRGWRHRLVVRLFAALLLAQAAIAAQTLPPGFPRAGASKVLENDRVIVWDATWPKNKATAMHEHPVDYLSVTLVEGAVKVTERDGTSSVARPAPFGFVRFNPQGTVHAEEGVSDQERRAILVELKTVAGVTSAGGTAQPFPREGAVKGLENARVSVWDYTWTLGQRVQKYQRTRDAVIVFLKGGVVRQLPEQGSVTEVRRTVGDVVYEAAGSEALAEEAVLGPPRAVCIQLK